MARARDPIASIDDAFCGLSISIVTFALSSVVSRHASHTPA